MEKLIVEGGARKRKDGITAHRACVYKGERGAAVGDGSQGKEGGRKPQVNFLSV